jgi:hypothetical protein
MSRSSLVFFALTLVLAACGSSTSSGYGGGATTSGTGGTASASAPDCATYCDEIMASCTGTHAQYSDAATCKASCAAFPLGKSGDVSGDTLGCRVYHVGVAKTDPTHCTHAGPGGDGLCGTNCQGFCDIAMKACPAVYTDAAACAADCATFKDDVAYDAAVATGDSLACRLYHLTVASVTPDPHCGHINSSSPTCVAAP